MTAIVSQTPAIFFSQCRVNLISLSCSYFVILRDKYERNLISHRGAGVAEFRDLLYLKLPQTLRASVYRGYQGLARMRVHLERTVAAAGPRGRERQILSMLSSFAATRPLPLSPLSLSTLCGGKSQRPSLAFARLYVTRRRYSGASPARPLPSGRLSRSHGFSQIRNCEGKIGGRG